MEAVLEAIKEYLRRRAKEYPYVRVVIMDRILTYAELLEEIEKDPNSELSRAYIKMVCYGICHMLGK